VEADAKPDDLSMVRMKRG